MIYYPPDLIPEIKKIWSNIIPPSAEKPPKLPSDKVLRNLFDIAYQTSLKTEEQRNLTYCLYVCSKDEFEGFIQHEEYYYKGVLHNFYKDKPHFLRFRRRRKFSISELRRLAPATNPSHIAIGVEPLGSGDLGIWGLIDFGSSWGKLVRGEIGSAKLPPNILIITSSEPGHIKISRSGHDLITFKGGQINYGKSVLFGDKPVDVLLKNKSNKFFKSLDFGKRAHECEPAGVKYTLIKRMAKDQYINFFRSISLNIQSLGHGGTLLLVPENTILASRLKIKYPVESSISKILLAKKIELLRQRSSLNMKIYKRKEKILSKDELENRDHIYAKSEANDRSIADLLNFLGALSQVDGAVVLTDTLKILGFGAEIIIAGEGPKNVKIADNIKGSKGKKISAESYGTRHRSAFRFCSKVDSAIAFVFSQDGETKVIKKSESEVVVWPDII